MTPTEQAARWLADVPRYDLYRSFNALEATMCKTDNHGDWIKHADALAAIARHLAPGDDLVAQLMNEHEVLMLRAFGTASPDARTYDADGKPGLTVGEIRSPMSEAADRISALTAQRDDFKSEWDKALELADRAASLMSEMDDRRISAEREAATLRDRLARMEGALTLIAELTESRSIMRLARAALTDGGSNG